MLSARVNFGRGLTARKHLHPGSDITAYPARHTVDTDAPVCLRHPVGESPAMPPHLDGPEIAGDNGRDNYCRIRDTYTG